jgi:hypothetical protein
MAIRDEAGKWGLEVDTTLRAYQEKTKAVLGTMASRGRLCVPGAAQDAIVDLGQAVKRQLVKVNAELYQKERQKLAQVDETEQRVTVGLGKLDLEQYKARLENALALERAQADFDLTARKAELAIMRSEIERRMAAIIEEQAKIEAENKY